MAFASEVIDFDSVLKIKYFYNLDLSIATGIQQKIHQKTCSIFNKN